MPDSGANLEALITLKTDASGVDKSVNGAVGGLNKVTESASKAEKGIKGAEGGLKGYLKELKQQGGRRSALGETVELLRGAGSVIAVSMIGEAIKKAADKIKELKDAYQGGKLDASGTAVKIGEALPIVGTFVEAGQTIREMITGEEAYIESIKRGTEWMNKFADSTIKGEMALGRRRRRANETAEDLAADSAGKDVIGEKNKQRFDQGANYEGKLRSAADEKEDSLQDIKSRASDEMQKNENEVRQGFAGQASTLIAGIKKLNPFANSDEIEAKFQKSMQDEIERRNSAVKAQAKKDSEQVEQNYEIEKAALEKWNTAEQARIEGVKKETAELEEATEKIGKSALDQYAIDLKAKGYSPAQAAPLIDLKAKELGAEMRESLLTPFEKYRKANDELKQLLDKDAISKQTYLRGQMKNIEALRGSVKGNNLEDDFFENVGNRFLMDKLGHTNTLSGVNFDKDVEQPKVNVKGNAEDTDNTKAVKDNTDQVADLTTGVNKLNTTVKGLAAVFV